jgi:aerobic carbon-monoxide dehydrogenase large subunit
VSGDGLEDARSIPRLQSRRLVQGGGIYVGDVSVPGALHAMFVRSPFPFAKISAIDDRAARALPGVHGCFTLTDLRAMGAGTLLVGWVLPGQHAIDNELLAGDVARYVGDPIAVVVADTLAIAQDAAELVAVEYEPLEAVADVDRAREANAPLLHPSWGDNVMARTTIEHGDPDAAFSAAAVVVADRFRVARCAAMPMEPCGAVASYDRFADVVTLVTSTQSPHHVRSDLAACLGRPEASIRVIAPDVGGSFGAKDHAIAPEAIVCLLALHLGRPVRWTEQRSEHVASTGHSRGQFIDIELAADADGRVLAMRGTIAFDAGAYASSHGIGTAIYSAMYLPGAYRFQDYRVEAIGVMTNKAPSGAYRGYGGPEAAFVTESLMDALARELGLDPVEVRRRNLLGPQDFPYRSASGCEYDVADPGRLLDMALDAAGYEAFRNEHRAPASCDDDTCEGIGVAVSLLMGGFGPSRQAVDAGMRYGGYETAIVRLDADGRATVFTGMPTQGQGIDTSLAQACASQLGLDPTSDVTVVAGDTALTPFSPVGPIASRGAVVGGSAVDRAAGQVAATLRSAAAALLEAQPDDIELVDGRVQIRGAPEHGLSLAHVAGMVRRGQLTDWGVEPVLEAVAAFDPPELTYSYTAHVAQARVDRATGRVDVLRYVTASDCGTLLNPAIVRGQIEGGAIQGIGGALMEEIAYGADGGLLTGSLLDYGAPSAPECPEIVTLLMETPTPRNSRGIRGAGEIGIVAPAAAIANAVADALGPTAPAPREIPMTLPRVAALARSITPAG